MAGTPSLLWSARSEKPRRRWNSIDRVLAGAVTALSFVHDRSLASDSNRSYSRRPILPDPYAVNQRVGGDHHAGGGRKPEPRT